MTKWGKIVAIPALSVVLLWGPGSAGCRNHEEPQGQPQRSEDFQADTGHTLVEASTFLRLIPGMSRREAKETLGTGGRHVFTYLKDGDTYLLTTHFVRNRPETESGIAFYCLFKNDALYTVLQSLPKNLERYPYRGTTATRPKKWRVQDESRILEILSLRGLSREDVARVIDRYSQPRTPSEPNIPPWVFESLLTPAYKARVRKGYERNRELLRQFDGLRIEIGMVKAEVDGLLGNPAHTEAISPTLAISIYTKKIYGADREENLEINSSYRFSPVAVVFEDGKVTRVYSSGFISRDWMPNGAEFGL